MRTYSLTTCLTIVLLFISLWPGLHAQINLDRGVFLYLPCNDQAAPNRSPNALAFTAGQTQGLTLANGYHGLAQQAFYFAGNDSQVLFADAPQAPELGLSFWFKATMPDHTSSLIAYETGGFRVGLTQTGKLEIIIRTTTADQFVCASSQILTTGEWHHVVVNFGQGKFSAFVDQQQIHAQAIPSGLEITFPNATLFLGNLPAAGHAYRGLLDEVLLYNRPLTAAERHILHHLRRFEDGIQADLETGLVMQTSFDRGYIANESPNAVNQTRGYFQASGKMSRVQGSADLCISLNGQDDHLRFSPHFQFPEFSYSFWLRTSSREASELVDWEQGPFRLELHSDSLVGALRYQLLTSDGQTLVLDSKKGISDGEWHHVLISCNQRTAALYLDQELQASTPIDTQLAPYPATAELTIGAKLDGHLDDVHIYNRALSAAEVAQLHLRRGLNGLPLQSLAYPAIDPQGQAHYQLIVYNASGSVQNFTLPDPGSKSNRPKSYKIAAWTMQLFGPFARLTEPSKRQ